MNTPPKQQKEKQYKSKKTHQQRDEVIECREKDAIKSKNQQHSQTEVSAEKEHYLQIERHHYLARERKRKSRSERNKRRERRKQIQQKTEPKEQSEFRRHVRKAQEITSRSIVDHQTSKPEAKPVTVITQNRLTRKLGLFNQGKKSNKISRDTITVPESVQLRVEKDLKEIINQKSSTEAHSIISVNDPSQQSNKSLLSESVVDDNRSPHHSCHLPRTPSSATKPSASQSWATTSPESQISGVTNLPETPPWEAISKDFEESLNFEEIFPDKEDYLNTVFRDLKKVVDIYGSSQKTQLFPQRKSEVPSKGEKLSVRRRLDFAREEVMIQDGGNMTAAKSTVKEFVGKECLEPVMEKRLDNMHHHKMGHERKMAANKVTDKKTSTEELMNAMMDGLQFLKNADEVNKIWSTSRSNTNSQSLNVYNTSESNLNQSLGTDNSMGISAHQRRHRHCYIMERHHNEFAGVGQECTTYCCGDRMDPVFGPNCHQREWRKASSDSHQQQREEKSVCRDRFKSDSRVKNVTEDIPASSHYHHPSVSSYSVTYEPVGYSPNGDVSHDLLNPRMRRQGYPFKRFRMMESSDTDDDDDEDLFPSWYMDVNPPKMSAIESPKFYPQKMF